MIGERVNSRFERAIRLRSPTIDRLRLAATNWAWFHDNIDGAYFVDHDPPLAPGTVSWQPDYLNHPLLKGLANPWNASDEWYVMNRNVEAVPGFKVIAKVTVSNSSKGTTPRPAVWIRENANGKGLCRSAVPGPDAARDSVVGSPIARWRLDRFRKRELLAC